MDVCENIQSLRKVIIDSLEESLLNATHQGDIQRILLDAIQEGVYDDYEPTQYIRREENKGLGDANLIQGDVVRNVFSSDLTLTARSTAKTNGGIHQGYVDAFVVEGIYDWKASGIAKRKDPTRDFYALAEKKLKPEIETILENELARLGIETK